ncbi:MAG: head decoration protein [Syntrophaceae bacterium]
MSVQVEPNRLNDILKFELDKYQSREVVTLALLQNLAVGAVLGKITKGACPTTGTEGTNTGAGTCTSVTAGAKAKVGTYTLKCIIAASGAGIFSVEDPDGFALPEAIVAVAYENDQINFTLNDASPDFVVGDTFTIEIAAGSGQVTTINFDAVDGSADAYGILAADTDATSAAKSTVAIVRDAQVVEANLVWPTTSPAVSAAQKAAAMAQLKDKGIVAVVEA